MIERQGHGAMWEAADRFNSVVTEFLTERAKAADTVRT
jgi:hypothetical protein